MLCVTDEVGAEINIIDEVEAEIGMLHVTDEVAVGNTSLEPPGHIFHITMQPLLKATSQTCSRTSTPLLHLQNSSGVIHISVRNFSR